MNSDDFNELIGIFVTETQEFLQSLEANLLLIESSSEVEARSQAVQNLFRAAHSIKGSALMFGFETLSTAAHCLEDSFAILRDRADLAQINPTTITALLQGVDLLRTIANQVCQPEGKDNGATMQATSVAEVEAIAQILAQLENQYTKPAASSNGSSLNNRANLQTIKRIFEQDLLPVFNHLETELSQVKPETLEQTIATLNQVYYQLSGVAGMLQLAEFGQIVEYLRTLIDTPHLSVELLQKQGWEIAQNLQSARTQLLQGEAITIQPLNGTELKGLRTEELGLRSEEAILSTPESPVDNSSIPFSNRTEVTGLRTEEPAISTPELPVEDSSTPASLLSPQSSLSPQPSVLSPQSSLSPQPSPSPHSSPVSSPTGWQRPTIRVDLERLSELVNLVGELVINRTNLELQETQLRTEAKRIRKSIVALNQFGTQLREEYDRLSTENSKSDRVKTTTAFTKSLPSTFDLLELDQYTEFHSTAQSVIETTEAIALSGTKIDEIAVKFERSTDQLRRITDQLRSRVMQLRVVPFSRAVDHLPRALRDLCRLHNKEVNLLLLGRDTTIDESLLDALRDPLVHLVRNAFDHGIETPQARLALGKPPSGQIEIEAFHQGGQTIITITDDGRGIDPEAIRAKVVAGGFVAAEQANELSIADLYEFLFWPGFSTTREVTELSGRGVGLDVVRTNLRQVRGTVKVDSRPGKGTSFILKLPLMLSISDALMVKADRNTVAIPLDAVEEILHIQGHQIQMAGTQTMLWWREEFIRLVRLQELLHYSVAHPDGPSPDPIAQDYIPVMVLASSEGVLAVVVERLIGQQEVVVKALPLPLSKPRGIVGCTIMGDGQVVTILDVDDLIGQFYTQSGTTISVDNKSDLGTRHSTPLLAPTGSSQPQILVVDDSYTIRQLLSLTLIRARYRVAQAKDGQDALSKLEEGLNCDLIIADIEMPRMDGFELLRNLKSQPQFASIPVAMLTSRSGFKHRQMALELGAIQYFTKPYNEVQLLEAIAKLIKH
ncbi:hybrid sensor histidine kinase/response regulator [Coleofasciculus sp. FACHB-SPT9]|uniref:hybrid sensor histidine kinase/response regulator n=1 Tax=Cyanophyceae TaxID=3028117 RepID=UPI001684E6ED|nr:hybrid sensor histidine kinase/response regulator [Coleofasciculus sp. FACHB-SPT9]MBD1891638.1 hybrid sensor histidine kinase/response regulator [Coleofasciculus sp. FACHB-SPT9]